MDNNNTSSYIDTDKLTATEFSPYSYANALVLRTNNPSDPSIDLTTPLSRALFDLQEIDSNIHSLTSRSALEILTHTSTQNAAAAQIMARVEEERSRLNASYERLEKEVIGQYTKATNAKLHAERSQQVLELARNVQRISNLARQFEILSTDFAPNHTQMPPGANRGVSKEGHRSIVQASYIILAFRQLMNGKDAADLSRINNVRTIRGRVFEDGEARVLDFARRVIREFSISSLTAGVGFKESEDTRARFTSATHILYLLTPLPQSNELRVKKEDFNATYLIQALQEYLSNAIKSSSAGIARALGQLPTLERALPDVSARCQSISALETLLRGITPPAHPLILPNLKAITTPPKSTGNEHESDSDDSDDSEDNIISNSTNGGEVKDNLLSLLLESLDTSSLPSYFWRSLASQLSSRVQEILNRGGIAARTLRANRDEVRNQIRECVLKGSKMPGALVGGPGQSGKEQMVGNWEREAAVMVGSVTGPLSR